MGDERRVLDFGNCSGTGRLPGGDDPEAVIERDDVGSGDAFARQILENMDEAFTLLDGDFRVADLNRLALQIDGRPREELIGRPIWELAPGLEESPFGASLKQVVDRQAAVSAEHLQVWPDGHSAWVEARAFPVSQGVAVVYRDITERRRADDALRASEELNRRILESSTDCIKVLSLDGRLEFMSEGGTGVMEVEDLPSLLGRRWEEFWPEQERHKVAHAVKEAAQGRTCRFQGAAPTAKGNLRWWDVAVSAIQNRDGEPERLLSISRDISPTHQVEERLAETSRRLDAILNNTTMAVFLMDDRQHCVFANAAAEKLTGYRLDQMAGRPLHDVVHHKRPDGSHYPLEECPIDRAFPERSQMQGEELFVAPDGSLYPVAFTASPLVNEQGMAIGTVIEVRNIEHEKEAEARLRTLNETGVALAAELDLERIVQMVTDAGVSISRAQFGAFFYNMIDEEGESFLLYSLAGADRSEFDGFGHPRATDVFAPTFKGEGVVRSDDITTDPRYGHNPPHNGMPAGHLPVRSYLAVPVTSRSGEVIGGLFFGHSDPGVFTTDSESLLLGLAGQAAVAIDNARLFEANQRARTTLEQRVEERTKELETANEALRQSQKMEAIGQLTGGIAHDFNNLLTVVTGNIDMASRALQSAGMADPRARRALDNAMKGAERAASLTQRLLAFSRRQPLAPKPIDVDKLVLSMSDMLNRALGEVVNLEIVTSPGLWRIEADPNQLESAILNLAVNARDAMPQGGDLTIETANARLDDDYVASHAEVAPGQYVVIAVTDTGMGMPREVAARVFEPFYTTKEVGKGTGLGLSMVYGFVKQSGGHVKIYTEEGHGTTVKIYLPRLMSEDATDDEAMVTQGLEVSRHRETILVVEDDDDVRAYTVECLRELGYRVIEAHDGPSALRLLERQESRLDLLFTDVVMPGMSGRELADAARERQPGLKVLYTSGYTRNAIVHGGRLDPGVELIAKPFTYQALAQKVRDMLDRGKSGRILVVEADATVRALAGEALAIAGYTVDEAANAAELLAKVRSAQGAFDALVLDFGLPDRAGDSLVGELRALYVDLPILIATSGEVEELRTRFSRDRCVGILKRPYTSATLQKALLTLGVSCSHRTGPSLMMRDAGD